MCGQTQRPAESAAKVLRREAECKRFVGFWFRNEKASSFYENELLSLWRDLEQKDYFDTYTYWVFDVPATREEVGAWSRANE